MDKASSSQNEEDSTKSSSSSSSIKSKRFDERKEELISKKEKIKRIIEEEVEEEPVEEEAKKRPDLNKKKAQSTGKNKTLSRNENTEESSKKNKEKGSTNPRKKSKNTEDEGGDDDLMNIDNFKNGLDDVESTPSKQKSDNNKADNRRNYPSIYKQTVIKDFMTHVSPTTPKAKNVGKNVVNILGDVLVDTSYLVLFTSLYHTFVQDEKTKSFNSIYGSVGGGNAGGGGNSGSGRGEKSSSSLINRHGKNPQIELKYENIANSIVYLYDYFNSFFVDMNHDVNIPLTARNPKLIHESGNDESSHPESLLIKIYMEAMSSSKKNYIRSLHPETTAVSESSQSNHTSKKSNKTTDTTTKNPEFQKLLKSPISYRGYVENLNNILFKIVDNNEKFPINGGMIGRKASKKILS